ncbi:MAG: ATP synthase F1 subunit delta [Bacteroidales bacterium]|nr:ATP synthase F1 subunit delta [Bacteroidales bacterium]MBR1799836.1 ATP synthase F1 subunit delta [Bacteroidales bacterium]
MNSHRININYAKALFTLATDTGQVEQVVNDMRLILSVCNENRHISLLMGNPTLPFDKKKGILHAIFASHICQTTLIFLDFVVKKKRSINLKGISQAFIDLYRTDRGIVPSDITTRQSISQESLNAIRQKIEDYTEKTAEVSLHIDERILGGFIIEFDNNMYDARIKSKIDKLRFEFAKNDYESKL